MSVSPVGQRSLSSSPPRAIVPVRPCAPPSSLQPQAPLASLRNLLSLHYMCNPPPRSHHAVGSLRHLYFCPSSPRGTSAVCPLLFLYVLLERITTLTVTICILFCFFRFLHISGARPLLAFPVLPINTFTELLSLSPWWQFQPLPTQGYNDSKHLSRI